MAEALTVGELVDEYELDDEAAAAVAAMTLLEAIEYEPATGYLDFHEERDEDDDFAEGEDWLADQAKEKGKRLRFAARQQLGSRLTRYDAAAMAARREGLDLSGVHFLSSSVVRAVADAMAACDIDPADPAGDWQASLETYARAVQEAFGQLESETTSLVRAVALARSRFHRSRRLPTLMHRSARVTRPRARESRRTRRVAAARAGPSSHDPPLDPPKPRRAAA